MVPKLNRWRSKQGEKDVQLFNDMTSYFLFITACLLTFLFALTCKLLVVYYNNEWWQLHGDVIAATLLTVGLLTWMYFVFSLVVNYG